jgi:hypothetical protein
VSSSWNRLAETTGGESTRERRADHLRAAIGMALLEAKVEWSLSELQKNVRREEKSSDRIGLFNICSAGQELPSDVLLSRQTCSMKWRVPFLSEA